MDPVTESHDGRPSEVSVPETKAGAGEWSVGHGLVADDLEEVDIDFVLEWDPSKFVIVEEKLKAAYAKVGVEPPDFFPLSLVRARGKDHHAYVVHMFSTPTGLNFGAFGGYFTDEYVARQHATFISLEVLLMETGTKVWDFNYQVAFRYKEQVAELERESRLCLPERVFHMEEELAALKHWLRHDKARYEKARKLRWATSARVLFCPINMV